MKKILLLLVLFCLICTLAACKQPSITSDATSNILSDNKTIHITTSSKEDTTSSDYTFKDISDKRITTIDNKKNLYIQVLLSAFQQNGNVQRATEKMEVPIFSVIPN